MSAETIAKGVIIIALMFVLIGFLYPGDETGWNDFNESLQSFPSFVNPFSAPSQAVLVPDADGGNAPADVHNAADVLNCDESDDVPYFGCVITQDGDESYLETTSGDGSFTVSLSSDSGVPGTVPILSVVVEIECSTSTGESRSVQAELLKPDATPLAFVSSVACGSTDFRGYTIVYTPVPARPTFADINGGAVNILVTDQDGSGTSPNDGNISFIRVQVAVGAEPECTSADSLAYIGCILTTGLTVLIKGVIFLLNGGIYVGQIIAYGVGVFVALMGVVAFFFAVPGAPPVVQGIFTAFFIGFVFLIILAIANLVRGTGTGIG